MSGIDEPTGDEGEALPKGVPPVESLDGDTTAKALADGVESNAVARTRLTSALDQARRPDGGTTMVPSGARMIGVISTTLPESDDVDTAQAFAVLESELGGDLGLNPDFAGNTKAAIKNLGLPVDPDAE